MSVWFVAGAQELYAASALARSTTYAPLSEHRPIYDELYAEYVRLHDLFGRGGDDVMRRLKRQAEGSRYVATAVAPSTRGSSPTSASPSP